MDEIFVEVAVPVALYDTFIYKVPLPFKKEDLIGRKVKVPFKYVKHYGIILKVQENTDLQEIKDVFSVEEKVFTQKEINILREISDFYISPIGLTIDYFVPDKIREKNIKDEFLGKVFSVKHTEDSFKHLTQKQKELINLFLENDYLTYQDIKQSGFDKKTLNSLISKGLVEVKEGFTFFKDLTFSSKEKLVYEEVKSLENRIYLFDEFYPEKRFNYYIHLAKKLDGKGVHIVLPSVELCNLYYKEFSKRFKNVEIYHDELSLTHQWNVWQKATKESLILIGTISSMLIPLKDLKVFIVEEEDSKVYKVKRTPKVDVKRVAYYIHKEKKVPVILASSIPSLESFLSFKKGQIIPLISTNPVFIKNLKVIPHKNINEDLIKIKEIVLKSKNTLIVANKGYYSSFLFCERCGWQANCQKCGFHLTVHIENGKKYLECSRCKSKYEYISTCPECDFRLTESGFGKEKIEISLKKTISQDFWNKFKVVSSVELKTLTLGKYESVINVYPDFLLEFPDFRSSEFFLRKVFLPLTVCIKNYIIITNQEKYILQYINHNTVNIKAFLEKELEKRKKLRLPPFIKTVKLEIENFKLKTEILDSFILNFFKNLNLLKKILSDNKGLYIFEYKKEEEKTLFKEFYKEASKRFKVSIEVNPIDFE